MVELLELVAWLELVELAELVTLLEVVALLDVVALLVLVTLLEVATLLELVPPSTELLALLEACTLLELVGLGPLWLLGLVAVVALLEAGARTQVVPLHASSARQEGDPLQHSPPRYPQRAGDVVSGPMVASDPASPGDSALLQCERTAATRTAAGEK